jgi:hypothetical protein
LGLGHTEYSPNPYGVCFVFKDLVTARLRSLQAFQPSDVLREPTRFPRSSPRRGLHEHLWAVRRLHGWGCTSLIRLAPMMLQVATEGANRGHEKRGKASTSSPEDGWGLGAMSASTAVN